MKNKIFSLLMSVFLLSCMEPEARRPITIKSASISKESISLNKSINKKEESVFKTIMAKDSLTTYISSPSGFWYTYNIKSPNLTTAEFGDQIVYTYDVLDVENNVLYSSNEIGLQTYVVDKQELIEGLRNGLKLMHEGDIVTFLFPSHKVFGYLGDHNKIGVNQSLIYKVQLIKINKKNESN